MGGEGEGCTDVFSRSGPSGWEATDRRDGRRTMSLLGGVVGSPGASVPVQAEERSNLVLTREFG